MLISSLIAIATVLIMGVISPGPSFIYVARNSVLHSRRHGLMTALGTGTGAVIFSLLAMLGLQKLLNALPEAFIILKVAGGAYLVWLAVKMYRGASQPLTLCCKESAKRKALGRTYLDGILTQLSNPKTAIIFASIFSALLPSELPQSFYIIIPVMCFVIDAGWYSLVAMLLSSERPRRIYLRLKKCIDRVSAAVLALLGGKLIFGSFSS